MSLYGLKLFTGCLLAKNNVQVPYHGPVLPSVTPKSHLTLQQKSILWHHRAHQKITLLHAFDPALSSGKRLDSTPCACLSRHLPQFVTMTLQLCPTEARKKATGGRCLAEPSALIFPSPGTAMALGKVVLGVFGSTEVKEYVVIGPVWMGVGNGEEREWGKPSKGYTEMNLKGSRGTQDRGD